MNFQRLGFSFCVAFKRVSQKGLSEFDGRLE